MKDFIYREEAIRICERLLNHEEKLQSVERETLIAVNKYLESIPAADVRPVIKCKWENLTRAGFASVEATCSACGKTLFYKSWWHFCPNCGAKVEKEQEDK